MQSLDAEFGGMPLNRITAHLIEAYLTRRREQDQRTVATTKGLLETKGLLQNNRCDTIQRALSAQGLRTGQRVTCFVTSPNRYLATPKTMFKTAVRWGYLLQSLADALKLLPEQGVIPNALTEEQLERLLGELPDNARAIMRLAADTGMRKSEMERLVWSDVLFDQHMIKVQETKNNTFRVIPMTDRVYALLLGLQEDQRKSPKTSRQVLPWQDMLTPSGMYALFVKPHELILTSA